MSDDFLNQLSGVGAEFDPEGLNQFLGQFRSNPRDPRSPVNRDRVNQLARDPRTVIERGIQLTKIQQRLLADTPDDELREDLKPVLDALKEGKSLRVDSVTTVSEQAAKAERVQAPSGPQKAGQIVITIGKGRCKITITIDL